MVFAVWTQTGVLAITACIIVWYTIETSRTRLEIARQTSISLRPVVVFEFRQDAAHNRMLLAKNIGQGAAFNVMTQPLNVVPGIDSWDVHFDKIYSLGSLEQKEVSYTVPVLDSHDDKGFLFFPQATSKLRELRIEYQDVEGRRYRQDLTVHPKKEGSSGNGYVGYAPIRELKSANWRNIMRSDDATRAGGVAPDRMANAEEFKSRTDLMKAFCETAKTYIQISAAALALPLLFTQAVLGKEAAEKGLRAVGVPSSLVLSWIFFLLAIGSGLAYQWLAIKLMWDELHKAQITEQNSGQPGFRTTWWVPQARWLNRSFVYGCMLVFFYLGAICFVVFAAHALQQ